MRYSGDVEEMKGSEIGTKYLSMGRGHSKVMKKSETSVQKMESSVLCVWQDDSGGAVQARE